MNKGNCGRVYMSILELRYNDYRQTQIKTDGSYSEKKSSTVKLDLKYIDEFIAHDLVTELMITELKKYMKLK
jgi:hypothetical protein